MLFLGSFMNMQMNLHNMINTCLFALNNIHLYLFILVQKCKNITQISILSLKKSFLCFKFFYHLQINYEI